MPNSKRRWLQDKNSVQRLGLKGGRTLDLEKSRRKRRLAVDVVKKSEEGKERRSRSVCVGEKKRWVPHAYKRGERRLG